MSATSSRREFLGLAAAGLAVTACSRGGSGGRRAAGGPVTITHIFGETTVPAPPKRVVSAGLTEHDDLLAVGVVPVAVTNWFGDQPFGVWPWARDALGAAKPVLLNLDNGIQVERIAALTPDLIVAVNAGLDAETYRKLSAIAPTIAQSGGEAFFEPWKQQAVEVGAAVFQAEAMARRTNAVEESFAAVAQADPRFNDKRVALLSGRFTGDAVSALGGWRTEFLTSMGFVAPALPDTIARTELPVALGSADVLVWLTESDDEKTRLQSDPAVAALKRSVFTTKDLAGAIAYASPLSYPVVAEQLPTLIGSVL